MSVAALAHAATGAGVGGGGGGGTSGSAAVARVEVGRQDRLLTAGPGEGTRRLSSRLVALTRMGRAEASGTAALGHRGGSRDVVADDAAEREPLGVVCGVSDRAGASGEGLVGGNVRARLRAE